MKNSGFIGSVWIKGHGNLRRIREGKNEDASVQEADEVAEESEFELSENYDEEEEEATNNDDESEAPRGFRFPFASFFAGQASETPLESLQREVQEQRESLELMKSIIEDEIALIGLGGYRGNGQNSFSASNRRFGGSEFLRSSTFRNRGRASFDSRNSDDYRIGRKVEKRLPEDSFSLLFTCAFPSRPFFYALAISCFQFMAYALVSLSVLDIENSRNPGNFPANVPLITRFAQAIALVLLIPLQDEILESMIMINDGYDNKIFERTFSGANKVKFAFSVTLRFLVGLLGIFTSFLLITGESQVLEIFFNFIALQFINQIDNLAFTFAREGILGHRLQGESIKVTETVYYSSREFHTHFHLLGLFCVVLGCWVWIVVLQTTGAFVSHSLEVQFSDDVHAALSFFSGIYERGGRVDRTGRFRYHDTTTERRAFFGYCLDLNAWTFTHDTNNPCKWTARSEETEAFEITNVQNWFIRDANDNIVPLDPFYFQCFYCADRKNPCAFGGDYRTSTGDCVCTPGRFGRRCEYAEPCPLIVLDTSDVGETYPREVPTDFVLLKNDEKLVKVYNKPVYIDAETESLVVIFNGRRWMMAWETDFNLSGGDLASTLAQGIHFFFTPVRSILISQPSDIGSIADNTFPKGLVFARPIFFSDGGQTANLLFRQIPTFDCAVCDTDLNPCTFGNPCVNGTCNCIDGSFGVFCKERPWGDGKCDVSFNTFVHQYDQGDCCEGSCLSTPDNFCGYNGTVFIGFENCVDEFFSCLPGTRCLSPNAARLAVDRPSGIAYVDPVLVLAPSGRVMAVGNPLLNTVRIYDRVDANWTQRGDEIFGPPNSQFGSSIALYTGEASILDEIVGPVGVRVAVGMVREDGPAIRVLEWSQSRTWQEILLDTSVAISRVALSTASIAFTRGGDTLVSQTHAGFVSTVAVEQMMIGSVALSCPASVGHCGDLDSASFAEDGTAVLLTPARDGFHSFSYPEYTWMSFVPFNLEYGVVQSRIAISRDGQVVVVALSESVSSFSVDETDSTIAVEQSTAVAIENGGRSGGDSRVRVLFFSRDGDGWVPLGDEVSLDQGSVVTALALSSSGLSVAVAVTVPGYSIGTTALLRYREGRGWRQIADSLRVDSAVSALSMSFDSSALGLGNRQGSAQTYYLSPFCDSDELHFLLFMLVMPRQKVEWTLTVMTETSRTVRSPAYPVQEKFKIQENYCFPADACLVLDLSVVPLESDDDSYVVVRIDKQERLFSPLISESFFFGC